MATINPLWSENQNVFTGQTIAASGSRTDDIDIATDGPYFKLRLVLTLAFHASATSGATVEVFSSVNSGTNDSTDPILAFEIPVSAGSTVRVPFMVYEEPYVAIKTTNNDSSQSITGADLTYAGSKVTSA